MQVNPTFSIEAPLKNGPGIITVYGLKNESEATGTAKEIFNSGLVKSIQVKEQHKETKRSSWQTRIVLER